MKKLLLPNYLRVFFGSLSGLVLSLASFNASALTADYAPTYADAAFYTFALTAIALSAAIIWAYREFRWMVYVALSGLSLLTVASMDGNLAYLLDGGEFVVWVVPYLLLSSTTVVGFLIVAMRLEEPHRYVRLRPWFLALAVVTALFPLSSFFWLRKISLVTMWVPVNVLFFAMLLSQALPPQTWTIVNQLQRRLTQAFPVAVAGFAVAVQVLHYTGEGLSQAQINQLNRLTALFYIVFSLVVVVWQIVANTQDKLRSDRQALEAERNEARLQLELAQSRLDYQEVMSVATQQRSRLATVSHDLKQPVIALRHAVDQMQQSGHSDDAIKLGRAIDYIAGLSRAYVNDHIGNDLADESEAGDCIDKIEVVDSTMFAHMLEQMFVGQARDQGIRLRIVCPKSSVRVEPLATMRIMTNLVSNALAHAKPRRIVIGFRVQQDQVMFQVHDDGIGIEEQALQDVFKSRVKGAESDGYGLGLGIVSELCRAAGMDLRLLSDKGRGTSVYVSLPRCLSSR